MIPIHRVNEAYDALNLPRDSSKQSVQDRIRTLRDRYVGPSDADRLVIAEEAVKTIEQAEQQLNAQRDSATSRTKSKSERDLDVQLQQMAPSSDRSSIPSEANVHLPAAKRTKTEEDKPEVKEEPSPVESPVDDSAVFRKLNSLMKDDSKYLRAVNVLFNLTKSVIDSNKFDPKTVSLISDSIDVACTSLSTTDPRVPLASQTGDNRKSITKVINLVLSCDGLKSRIEPDLLTLWSHSVLFRNALFEMDNFDYTRRCKELIRLVAELPSKSERWVFEILTTVETICTRAVCKLIPGRFNDTKLTMTEIFKISRSPKFTPGFQSRISQLQREIMSIK